MLNNVALDVVIGLVFIYLLYSLLVTVLSEIISNVLGMRATLLRQIMKRMLTDTQKKGELNLNINQFWKRLKKTTEDIYTFADRFYESPSIKYIARKKSKFSLLPLSYRTRKPSYISKENFSQTLIHLFRNKGNGNSDVERIAFCLKFNTLQIDPQTLSYLRNLFADAGNEINSFIINLENWFNDTMDRANGWYKRKARTISFIIGSLIALTFNIDSVKIAKILAVDNDARDQLITLSISAATDSTVFKNLSRARTDSLNRTSLLDSSYNKVMTDINNANAVLGLGWDFSSLPKESGIWNRIGYIVYNCSPLKEKFWGLLFTAIMLSLGAPFWFDLLNKLVSLRGTGIKPEEKKEKKGTKVLNESETENKNKININNSEPGKTNITNINEEPIETALRVYGEEIRREKGVVNVTKGYTKEGDGVKECLQVDVENQFAAIKIRSKYKSLFIHEEKTVPIIVSVTGLPKLLSDSSGGNSDKGLRNSTELLGWGSFCCLVKSIDHKNKIYILSCYHVLNGDYTWENDGTNRKIKNKNRIVANDYQGRLSKLFDIAFAEITDSNIIDFYQNSLLTKKPGGIASVSSNDVFNTNVSIEGYFTKLSTGIIVNGSKSVSFEYPVGKSKYLSHQLEDLIVISHEKSLGDDFAGTSFGDSGSIVLDNDGKALGMLVGNDLNYSYAIKFSNIYDYLGLEIYT